MAVPVCLCVYYRVQLSHLARLTGLASAMQASLRLRTLGLATELLRRPDTVDGQVTVMEVYHHPDGIGPALQATIDAAAESLAGLIAGQRHSEQFAPLSG